VWYYLSPKSAQNLCKNKQKKSKVGKKEADKVLHALNDLIEDMNFDSGYYKNKFKGKRRKNCMPPLLVRAYFNIKNKVQFAVK